MSAPRRVLAASLLLSGCGGGGPLLHPAHALAPAQVEAGAGVSTRIATGRARRELDDARELDSVGNNPELTQRLVRGAFHQALTSPGLAPWVNARVGLEGNHEGSITYTGRAARIGFRHVIDFDDDMALSAGLGASSLWTRTTRGPLSDLSNDGLAPAGVDWSARGFGADLPLVFGWTARADLLSAWVGARVGFETLEGTLPFVAAGLQEEAPASARRWYAGGLVGISVGISPIWVRFELDASYGAGRGIVDLPWADAESERLEERINGISMTPSGAVSVQF